jgi:TonB family protein
MTTLGGGLVVAQMQRNEEVVEEEIAEVEIDDFAKEEPDEPEPEEELEEPPSPSPQPDKSKKKTKVKKQEIQNVTEQTDEVKESGETTNRDYGEGGGGGGGGGKKTEEKKEEKKVEEKKEAPKKKEELGDTSTPRPLVKGGKPPKPSQNAAPVYPEQLRKKNIQGSFKVKLHIHKDGTVRGMKIISKSVTGTDDESLKATAEKMFLKEIVTAVKSWKFEPARHPIGDTPYSVWMSVTIPFTLK